MPYEATNKCVLSPFLNKSKLCAWHSSDGSELQSLRPYEEKDELYPWDVLKNFIWHTLDEEGSQLPFWLSYGQQVDKVFRSCTLMTLEHDAGNLIVNSFLDAQPV